MANSPTATVIEHLRKAMLRPDGGGLTDGQLLQRFIDDEDQRAFEALVRRHGPMVLGVCRRVIGHTQDAEDAFQAAFLVLARKAASVAPPEAVANWLYGVAYHTALKARAVAVRRRAREKQVQGMPEPQAVRDDLWQDLRPLLDRELSRLPDKYRLPAVLCDLEGRSRREVAQQLKIPEGTLSSRLTTARKRLAQRLRRLGLVVPAGALAAVLAESATAEAVPGALVVSTIRAVTLFAAPGAAMTPIPAAALAEGVLKGMYLSKLKFATALILVACGLATVAGLPAYRALPAAEAAAGEVQKQPPESPPKAAPAAAVPAQGEQNVKGSGKVVTKEIDVADFTAVEVGTAFRVEITQADKFRTTVTADDNVLPHIRVTKDGSTLKISLDGKNTSFSASTFKATVAMPALEGVSLTAASQVTCKGFKSAKAFKARVTAASKLEGDIEAGQVDFHVASASTVTLKGSAKEARIAGSAASSLSLGDFPVDRAEVSLSGASSATINVKEKLDYDLSGASRLQYRGDPTIGKQRTSGASSASRKASDPGKKDAK
jgi:RNA polymerase sigma factor (sigma-70 family)